LVKIVVFCGGMRKKNFCGDLGIGGSTRGGETGLGADFDLKKGVVDGLDLGVQNQAV